MVSNHELFNAEVREFLREEAAVPAMRPAIDHHLSFSAMPVSISSNATAEYSLQHTILK